MIDALSLFTNFSILALTERSGFFFKKRNQDKIFRYKQKFVTFEHPTPDGHVNDILGLEDDLPLTVELLRYTNDFFQSDDFPFLKNTSNKPGDPFRFFIDDTLSEVIEEIYDGNYARGNKIEGVEGKILYTLSVNSYYRISLRDKKDLERYNKDHNKWRDEEEDWHGMKGYIEEERREEGYDTSRLHYNKKRPTKPRDGWSVEILTTRTPGEYQKILQDFGISEHFYLGHGNTHRKLLFEVGNRQEFDIFKESPSLGRSWLQRN